MTENTPPADADVNVQDVPQEGTPQEGASGSMSVDDYREALKKANAEAARYRTERNELRKDAEAYRELKESEKTELERVKGRAEELEQRAVKAERELKLAHVLRAYGITDENADLLGDEPERFEERAEKIAALQAANTEQVGGKSPREIPVTALKPGASHNRQSDSPYDVLPGWQPSGPFADRFSKTSNQLDHPFTVAACHHGKGVSVLQEKNNENNKGAFQPGTAHHRLSGGRY